MALPRVAMLRPFLPVFVLLPLLLAMSPRQEATPTTPRQLAYLVPFPNGDGTHGAIWLISEDGHGTMALTDGPDCCLAWSPDGQRLYFGRQSTAGTDQPEVFTIMQFDFAAGELSEVSTPIEGTITGLAAAPDAPQLAFTLNRVPPDYEAELIDGFGCLFTIDLASGQTQAIYCNDHEGRLASPEYDPQSETIIAVQSGFESAAIAAFDRTPPEPSYYTQSCCFSPQLSPSDIRLYAIATSYYLPAAFAENGLTGNHAIFEFGQGLQGATTVLASDDPIKDMDLSPEGDRLAFTRNGGIEIIRLWDRSEPVALVAGHDPAWRPGDPVPPATATPEPSPAPLPTATVAATHVPTPTAAPPTTIAEAPANAAAPATGRDTGQTPATATPPAWLGPARAAVGVVMVVSGAAFVAGLVALARRRRG